MPWAWADDVDSTFDVFDINNLAKFWEAVNERKKAQNDTAADFFSTYYTVAAGDYVAAVSGQPSGSAPRKFSAKYLQQAIEGMINGNWVATLKASGGGYAAVSDFDGDAISGPKAARWAWGSLIGVDYLDIKAAVLGGHEWTRKYPREFADGSATAYTDTSAFANGHRARRLDNGHIYDRVAGAWVDQNDASLSPDVVTAYGNFSVGDYYGWWLFKDLWDVLNALRWLYHVGDWSADGTNNHKEAFGSEPTWAAAKTTADGDYGHDAGEDAAPRQWSRGTFGGGNYEASAYATRSKERCTILQGQIAKDVDFYAGIRTTIISSGNNTGDANGTGLTLDAWNKVATSAGVAAGTTTVLSGFVGSLTQPNWCPDPTTSGDEGQGWDADGGAFVIEKPAFTYLA